MSAGFGDISGLVDQIAFYWVAEKDSPLRRAGVGPAVASRNDYPWLESWHDRLVGEASAGIDAREAPHGGLCYLRFGAEAAVLRRIPALDPGGRPSVLSHALVGPAEILSASVALGLSNWPGWFNGNRRDPLTAAASQVDPDAICRPLRATDLDIAGMRAEMTHRARQVGAPLTRLVTETLRNAGGAFSIVDYPDSPTALLVGLVDVLDGVLGPLRGHTWSFSTFETAEPASEPRYVFLTHIPRSDFKFLRVRIMDLSASPGDIGHQSDPAYELAYELACALTDHYNSHGIAGVRTLLETDVRPISLDELPSWVARMANRFTQVRSSNIQLLYRVLRAEASQADLDQIWTPHVQNDLATELNMLDRPGFQALLLAWKANAHFPLPPSIGQRAVEDVLTSALETTQAPGNPTTGDAYAHDRSTAAAKRAVDLIKAMKADDVRTAVMLWERVVTDRAQRPPDEVVLRVANTAIDLWVAAGTGHIDDISLRKFADVLEPILHGVPAVGLLRQIHERNDEPTTRLLLHLLAGWESDGSGGGRSDRKRITDRHNARVYLNDPDVGFLANELASLPDPAQARSLLVDVVFRPDFERGTFVRELHGLLDAGNVPDNLVMALQEHALRADADDVVAVAVAYGNNMWRLANRQAALRPVRRPAVRGTMPDELPSPYEPATSQAGAGAARSGSDVDASQPAAAEPAGWQPDVSGITSENAHEAKDQRSSRRRRRPPRPGSRRPEPELRSGPRPRQCLDEENAENMDVDTPPSSAPAGAGQRPKRVQRPQEQYGDRQGTTGVVVMVGIILLALVAVCAFLFTYLSR